MVLGSQTPKNIKKNNKNTILNKIQKIIKIPLNIVLGVGMSVRYDTGMRLGSLANRSAWPLQPWLEAWWLRPAQRRATPARDGAMYSLLYFYILDKCLLF